MISAATSASEPETAIRERRVSTSDVEAYAEMMFKFVEQTLKKGESHRVPSRQDLINGLGQSAGLNSNQARLCLWCMENRFYDELARLGYRGSYAAGQR